MTCCLKSHRKVSRSGGLEPFGKRRKEFGEAEGRKAERAGASESNGSLVFPHLRFTILDGRSQTPHRVNRKSYISAIASRLAASKTGQTKSGQNSSDRPKSNQNQTDSNQKSGCASRLCCSSARQAWVNPPCRVEALAKTGVSRQSEAKTDQPSKGHCRPLPLIASYCQPSREDILSSLRPQKAINFSMFSTKSPPFSRCFNA